MPDKSLKRHTRKQYASNSTLAFGEEQKGIVTNALLALFASALSLMTASEVLSHAFKLPGDPISGLLLAAQVNVVPALCLLVAIRMVSQMRFFSKADIHGLAYGQPSRLMAPRIAFLQNTTEQAALLAIANFAVSTLGNKHVMGYMIGSALLFVAGRVLFWIGYEGGAKARAFGMVMTMAPAVGALCLYVLVIGWRAVDAMV